MKYIYAIIISISLILFMGICDVVVASTTTYTYDKLQRLTKVEYGNGTIEEYSYDSVGNRLKLT